MKKAREKIQAHPNRWQVVVYVEDDARVCLVSNKTVKLVDEAMFKQQRVKSSEWVVRPRHDGVTGRLHCLEIVLWISLAAILMMNRRLLYQMMIEAQMYRYLMMSQAQMKSRLWYQMLKALAMTACMH